MSLHDTNNKPWLQPVNLWKINQIFKFPAWMVCYIEETLMYSMPFTLSVLI